MSRKYGIRKRVVETDQSIEVKTWIVNTSILEDEDDETAEKGGLFSVYELSPTKKTIKLVLEALIPYIPETLAELVATAVAQEAVLEEEIIAELEKGNFENIADLAEESKVYNWYQSLNMNDFITWYDFYGQEKPSPEDLIEVKRFYQINKEVAEEILTIIKENINE